jgi:5-methylcytosine-specific restriction endonuclease McrA
MTSVLNEPVLVLNRNWQAIDVTRAEIAFSNLCRGVHTAIDTETMRPVSFAEWLNLPIRATDRSIGTTRGPVRVPTVIACVHFNKMPKKTPKLCAVNIRKRDENRCQYTNRVLRPGEGNLDHIIPRSRGGQDTWENLVYSAKEINQRKANQLPEEAGLKLIRKPRAPGQIPVMMLIEPRPDRPEWDHFLIR